MKLYHDCTKYVCPSCGRTFESEMACRGHLGRCPQKEKGRVVPLALPKVTGKKVRKYARKHGAGAAGAAAAHEHVSMYFGQLEQHKQHIEQQHEQQTSMYLGGFEQHEQQNLVRLLTNEIPHQLAILNQQVGDLKTEMENIQKVAKVENKEEKKIDWTERILRYLGVGLAAVLFLDVLFNSKHRDGLQGKLLGKLI